jgi:hypothetical protein
MADLDLIAELDRVEGYEIPVDPMDLLQCDSCQ